MRCWRLRNRHKWSPQQQAPPDPSSEGLESDEPSPGDGDDVPAMAEQGIDQEDDVPATEQLDAQENQEVVRSQQAPANVSGATGSSEKEPQAGTNCCPWRDGSGSWFAG